MVLSAAWAYLKDSGAIYLRVHLYLVCNVSFKGCSGGLLVICTTGSVCECSPKLAPNADVAGLAAGVFLSIHG